MKKIIYYLLQAFIFVLPPKLACMLNNLRQKIHKRNIIFSYDKNKKLFKVKEDNLSMYFYGKFRGINSYSYGIKYRVNELSKTYGLELIKFNKDDIILDCGANFGDLYTWTKLNKLKTQYISFEPSPKEFECLQLNCVGQINNQIALSNEDGENIFYIRSESADSSLIESSGGYNKKIKIKTITLNNYVKTNNIKKIKLFKLEAEGSEPEILEGSKEILNLIEFVAVDGGPERGVKSETTIDFITSFLEKNNFKRIFFKSNNLFIRALFKRS